MFVVHCNVIHNLKSLDKSNSFSNSSLNFSALAIKRERKEARLRVIKDKGVENFITSIYILFESGSE